MFGVGQQALKSHFAKCFEMEQRIRAAKSKVGAAPNYRDEIILEIEYARIELKSIIAYAKGDKNYTTAMDAVDKLIEVTLIGCEYQSPSVNGSQPSEVTYRFARSREEAETNESCDTIHSPASGDSITQ